MGKIAIYVGGSFGAEIQKAFSAREYGHADAVAQAIEFLAATVLPQAIALDHRLHEEGDKPDNGWQRIGTPPEQP